MKSKTSYKAVLYRHSSLQGGFWSGRAIDRQLNTLSGEPSNYWINDTDTTVAYSGTWSSGSGCGNQCFWGNDHWSDQTGASAAHIAAAFAAVRDSYGMPALNGEIESI